MVKKIIITGGLGYIGTELCKIYSGVSWHHKIIVIDNRFISERVNQIRNWNMEFIHGDILDKETVEQNIEQGLYDCEEFMLDFYQVNYEGENEKGEEEEFNGSLRDCLRKFNMASFKKPSMIKVSSVNETNNFSLSLKK